MRRTMRVPPSIADRRFLAGDAALFEKLDTEFCRLRSSAVFCWRNKFTALLRSRRILVSSFSKSAHRPPGTGDPAMLVELGIVRLNSLALLQSAPAELTRNRCPTRFAKILK